MPYIPFANNYGNLIIPGNGFPMITNVYLNSTQDAAGESTAFIGRVILSSGLGAAKTISAAGGGQIYYRPNTVTFANAGTTIRIGLQDVASTGLEDGTFDVYDDLVGATDTITAQAVNKATMSVGTKTLNSGDLVAVVIEMQSRGGADSVQISRQNTDSAMPYCTLDTGAGPVKSNLQPCVTIVFDDGTVGWLGMDSYACDNGISTLFASNSTPDEYCLGFQVPTRQAFAGALLQLSNFATTDDFEFILYSNPLGTPAVELSLSVDADLTAANFGWFGWFEANTQNFPIQPNTDYALALRPTTTNSLGFRWLDFNTGNGVLRKATTLGTNWWMGTRTNQSGAFTQDLTKLPIFGIVLNGPNIINNAHVIGR